MWVNDVSTSLDDKRNHDAKDGTWLYNYGAAADYLLEYLQSRGWVIVPPKVSDA